MLHPSLTRRRPTNDRFIRLRRLNHNLYGDLMKANVKSKRMNEHAHIFGADNGWCRAHPIRTKGQAPEALSILFHRDGVPPALIVDGAKEFVSIDYKKRVRQAGCDFRTTEPYSPWQNTAEGTIRELKKDTARVMLRTGTPKRLWDDCLEHRAYIRSHTALNIYNLDGEVPETMMTGQTANIGPWCDFQWYQWIKYYDETSSYPDDKMTLGRYLGPSPGIGSLLTGKLLKRNSNYHHTSTFRALTPEEMADEAEKALRNDFTANVNDKLGNQATPKDFGEEDLTPTYDPYEDDSGNGIDLVPDRDEQQHDYYDRYINAEVMLARGDNMLTGKVTGRKREADGSLKGNGHSVPMLDTRKYTVEFPDGAEATYAANVLAEGMYLQCDENGNQFLLLDSIVEHETDKTAIQPGKDQFRYHGRLVQKRTTKGWKLCVQWKDGTTSWERLADLKESFPSEVAEYSVAAGIDHLPAFKWWVPYILKKRNAIISKVKSRYHKRTHKFGIRIPKTVEEARDIDRINGNDLWEKALEKEMSNVRVAFKMLNEEDRAPVGHTRIKCHIIFDVKMETLRRKCRLVAGGHMTEAPCTSVTYSSVVSRESVRIALTLAALNDLEIKAADIQNAYLTAPLVSEKIWTVCGPEFGKDEGRKAIVVRALYGLRAAGHDYRSFLSEYMLNLGWKSCQADPDVYYMPMTRPDDGFEYYAYALLYVDDILMVHHDAMGALKQIDKAFTLKPDSVGDPDIYLGAKFRTTTLRNGVIAYTLSPSKYVQENVRLVADYLERHYSTTLKKPSRAKSPLPNNYRPELDLSEELEGEEASYYQSLVGILRWMVELGRVDIITEVSMLASHLALPRRGHLESIFHMFAYLKSHHNATVVMDPTYPTIDHSVFKTCNWADVYPGATEPIPSNAPEPRGKSVDIRLYVDSDLAGDNINRRSRTGYMIYVNSALVIAHSKKQARIETSVFGAEFCALTQGMDRMRGLRYKLRMMGIPLEGPTFTYGDNMSVIHNTQRPDSTLKKKCNSISYHACREAVAAGEMITGHVPSEKNPADIATKIVPPGQKRNSLLRLVMYDFD